MPLKPRSFTLLEMIVVLIIIGVLATLGFSTYAQVIERARDAEANNELKLCLDQVQASFLENASYGVATVHVNLSPLGMRFYTLF